MNNNIITVLKWPYKRRSASSTCLIIARFQFRTIVAYLALVFAIRAGMMACCWWRYTIFIACVRHAKVGKICKSFRPAQRLHIVAIAAFVITRTGTRDTPQSTRIRVRRVKRTPEMQQFSVLDGGFQLAPESLVCLVVKVHTFMDRYCAFEDAKTEHGLAHHDHNEEGNGNGHRPKPTALPAVHCGFFTNSFARAIQVSGLLRAQGCGGCENHIVLLNDVHVIQKPRRS